MLKSYAKNDNVVENMWHLKLAVILHQNSKQKQFINNLKI